MSLNYPCDSLDFVLVDWSMCLVNSVNCLSSLTPLSPCLPFDSLDKIQSLQDSKLDNPLRHLVICSTGLFVFVLCQLLSTLGCDLFLTQREMALAQPNLRSVQLDKT